MISSPLRSSRWASFTRGSSAWRAAARNIAAIGQHFMTLILRVDCKPRAIRFEVRHRSKNECSTILHYLKVAVAVRGHCHAVRRFAPFWLSLEEFQKVAAVVAQFAGGIGALLVFWICRKWSVSEFGLGHNSIGISLANPWLGPCDQLAHAHVWRVLLAAFGLRKFCSSAPARSEKRVKLRCYRKCVMGCDEFDPCIVCRH